MIARDIHIALDLMLGGSRNGWTDICAQLPRVAELQFVHSAYNICRNPAANAFFFKQRVVQGFPHAMQALKVEISGAVCEFDNGLPV